MHNLMLYIMNDSEGIKGNPLKTIDVEIVD